MMNYSEYLKSPGWRERRNRVINLDGAKCVLCGSTLGLQVHHLNYFRVGNEDLNDLVTLCSECHRKISDNQRIEKAEKSERERRERWKLHQNKVDYAVAKFMQIFGKNDLGFGGDQNLLRNEVSRRLWDQFVEEWMDGVEPSGGLSRVRGQIIDQREKVIDQMLAEHPDFSISRIVRMTGFKYEMVQRRKLVAERRAEESKRRISIDDVMGAGTEFDTVMFTRISNSLKSDNIFWLGDLVNKTESDLRKVPNIGDLSIRLINSVLRTHGLRLKEEE